MSRSDFDVVTGPSMVQHRTSRQEPSRGSSTAATDPAAATAEMGEKPIVPDTQKCC